jgi:hypothetical protein
VAVATSSKLDTRPSIGFQLSSSEGRLVLRRGPCRPGGRAPGLATRSQEDGITRFADESRSLPVCGRRRRPLPMVWSDCSPAGPHAVGVHRILRFGGRSDPGLLRTSVVPKDQPEARGLTVVWMTGLRSNSPVSCRSKSAPSRTSLEAIFVAIVLREPEAPKTNQRVRRPAAWSRLSLFRPHRPCEPPNRAASRTDKRWPSDKVGWSRTRNHVV